MFASNYTARTDGPHLYLSLDTTLDDQAIRLLGLHFNLTVSEIVEGRDEDHDAWAGQWTDVLTSLPNTVRFTDRPSTTKHVRERVLAETEFLGRPPVVTVVDNVADLLEEEEGPAEYHRIFGDLRHVARDTGTMVMALHHLRRKPARYGSQEQDQGTKPVMKTDVLYGGDREAQYIVGLWRNRPDVLSVGVLKNRMGQADPSSLVNVKLRADYARGSLVEDPLMDNMPAPRDDDRRREEWHV